MSYQVFFVEDEIVTREGIRDNVDWHAHGFELCGEAPDGEIALPLLCATQPDVLITDIKMPFLDGLQLCKIVRERMPRTKMVILSGHDEFDYAQQAIQLGVTEYLLKPVTVRQLHEVLQRLGAQLDRERNEQEALERLRQQVEDSRAALAEAGVNAAEWLKVDRSALEDYLKCGVQDELDDFFDDFILPLARTRQASIVRNYVLLDIVFTTARLIKEWGGEPNQVLPELEHLGTVLANVNTIEHIKDVAQPMLNRALAYRDEQASAPRAGVIHQAREFIEHHYMDPDISLHVVASRVGHSPSHFSTVFSETTGRTFKGHLTEVRIKRAKELLRTTSLRTAEISEHVGYNDPHYFSLVFRKSTGLSPRAFRIQVQRAKPGVTG